MYCVRKMTEDLYWVGASERRLSLFENAYPLTNGVSYNSYLLLDEKTVLIDTVDKSVSGLFFENVDHVLGGRKLDYLIVQHMEPDHAATIGELVLRHPELTIVCNAKTRTMMQNFFTFDIDSRLHRAVYFSNVLGVDMGMFYKRRDYSTIVNGKNPIVAHEFLGDDVKGKTAIIVDDMIASGESMLDVARQIKDRGASRVFVCTTFGLFTEGLEKFDDYYRTGYIDRLITTNLTYLPPEIHNRPYFIEADMSKFMAIIIDSLNHDISISSVLNPTDKIHALIAKHNAERFGSVK